MELRKALKSLVALGTGATLVGATVLSALAAADLSTYPAPFVKAGAYDALIVVGASAKTDDVLGSVDIATSLQAANTVVKTVPGTSTTTTVEGDAFRIDTSADFLEKGEALNAVGVTTLTSSDLDALKDGTIVNAKGTFTYKQTITVNAGTTDFTVDPDDSTDTPAWYYTLANGVNVYTYKVIFTPALESDVDSSHDLDDLDKKSITLLGDTYSIVDTYCIPAVDTCRIDFMAGSAGDTLNVGESKTYTVGTTDYEVTLSYTDGTYAKFTVNGVTTSSLAIGETDVLADGSEIGVADILYQNYAGGVQQVEFYVGATKVRIAETDFSAGTGGSAVVGSNTVTDVTGSMKGTNSSAVLAKIEYLQFSWAADEAIYVKSGTKLSESKYNDDDQMFLNFDIEYKGLQEDTAKDTIELYSSGDDEYKLKFTNKAGDLLDVPMFDVTGTVMKSGNENYDLIVAEGANLGNTSQGQGYINRNDYFVVSDVTSKNTYLLRYSSIDTTGATVTFQDLGSGTDQVVSYSGTSGTLTLGGSDYDFVLDAASSGANVTVDLDASGAIGNGVLPGWWTQYGANITAPIPGNDASTLKIQSETGGDTVGTAVGETITVLITNTTADTVELGTVGGVALQTIGDTNNKEDYFVWGTKVYQTYAESGPDKLTITYPDDQTEHLVYYTSGATTSSTTTGGTTYNEVVAIGVDASVLDTEVTDFKAQNIIIVGGPCVNLAAAEVMGNPAVCTTGFEEGKAMIKLYERTNGKVALLVAGMTGMDTRRAARALGEYGSHKLTGTEMEVAGTSLTQYTVTAVTTA